MDVKNERSVIDQLSRLTLTRIIIAHRPETINSAERVVLIEDGHLSEIRPATVKYFTENDPSDKAEKREKA